MTDLQQMHDQELLCRAQYDQDNGPPDDLYVMPTAYAPSFSRGEINNFAAFSRCLKTIIYYQEVQQSKNTMAAPTRVFG
jgi:hypothetical protein